MPSSELIREWHATQTTEWGLNMMVTGSFKLREAERKAKQGRLGMWHNYVPPAGSATKQSGKFKGTVAEARMAVQHYHCLHVQSDIGQSHLQPKAYRLH